MNKIYKLILIIAFSSFFIYAFIKILIDRRDYKDKECIGVTEVKYIEGNSGYPIIYYTWNVVLS
jgi:hypothetical protein